MQACAAGTAKHSERLLYEKPPLRISESNMDKQVLTFTLERETKNTVRYKEVVNGQPSAIGTLYVQKQALGEERPERLTVVISAAES
jgi:hypothetical protein